MSSENNLTTQTNIVTNSPPTLLSTKRSIRFKKHKANNKRKHNNKKNKKKRVVISHMQFLKFIFMFVAQSAYVKVFLVVGLIIYFINYVIGYFLDSNTLNLSRNILSSKVRVLFGINLITHSLFNLVKPLYADNIGSIIQFKMYQSLCLTRTKHRKDPYTRKNSSEIYEMLVRHKEALEQASCILIFDMVDVMHRIVMYFLISEYTIVSNYNILMIFIFLLLFIIGIYLLNIVTNRIYARIQKYLTYYYTEVDEFMKYKNSVPKDVNININNFNMLKYNNPNEYYYHAIQFIGDITVKGIAMCMGYFISAVIVSNDSKDINMFVMYEITYDIVKNIRALENIRGKIYKREIEMYLSVK